MPWVMELRVVSLPATGQQDDEESELVVGELVAVDVGLDQLRDDVFAGVLRPVGSHLHRIGDQLDRRAHGVIAGELRVLVTDHLVGPVEQFHAVFLGHAQQAGDGLQRQLARHLFDEVAGALRRRGLDDALGTIVEVLTQPLDGARSEATGDDLAQVGVLGSVHVQQHELAGVALFADRALAVARQGGVLQTGKDVAAPRDLFDVLVFRHHPKAAVVEPAHPVGLLVPPDRRGPPQLGEFFHR